MRIRLAILGLDSVQHHWLSAVKILRGNSHIELVAVAHPSMSAARDIAEFLKASDGQILPTFDDPRHLLKEAVPQVILMDRPANATLEFLLTCIGQNIAILSLGPPVESVAEAHALSAALQPRSHLLYIWPRFSDSPALVHCAQADEFLRPIRFAAASWLGINHALAKTSPEASDLPVRSLSVLAWDALSTLIALMGLPNSVYAALRGTVSSGSSFADLSGAASVTLRFADDGAASLTLCDRTPTPEKADSHRSLMLWSASGTLKLDLSTYEFRDTEGKLIDARLPQEAGPRNLFTPEPAGTVALQTLEEFLRQYGLPVSPQRGWEHRLTEVAATMEALVVSHRTGEAESPEKFLRLRR